MTLEITNEERWILHSALVALTTDIVWATDKEIEILERILGKL